MKNATLEIADGKAVLTLANPPLNVLDIATMAEIAGALDQAAAEKDLRVLVIQADGRAFCAGVDVGEHMGDKAKVMIETFNAFIAKFLSFPLPTVALVKGAALGGGCEMLMACDMVYATPKAIWATSLVGRSGVGLGGLSPLSYDTIDAWARLNGLWPSPLEVDALIMLDSAMRVTPKTSEDKDAEDEPVRKASTSPWPSKE